MGNEIRQKKIQHRGAEYTIEIVKRPFRENLEIRTKVGDKVITVSEMGYGEEALIEKLKEEIDAAAERGRPDRNK